MSNAKLLEHKNCACLSVRLYPINSKRVETIGPKFCVGLKLTCPQGRFIDDQNFKNLPPTKFDFPLILKIHKISL